MSLLDIGEVVARSGLPVSTLHLWERRGLIASSGRKGLRRQYGEGVIDTLAVIVVSQRAGFTLNEIVELMAPDAFDNGKARLEAKLDDLRARRMEIDAAIDGLEHALACPEKSPLDCDGFKANLVGVLPVRAKEVRPQAKQPEGSPRPM